MHIQPHESYHQPEPFVRVSKPNLIVNPIADIDHFAPVHAHVSPAIHDSQHLQHLPTHAHHDCQPHLAHIPMLQKHPSPKLRPVAQNPFLQHVAPLPPLEEDTSPQHMAYGAANINIPYFYPPPQQFDIREAPAPLQQDHIMDTTYKHASAPPPLSPLQPSLLPVPVTHSNPGVQYHSAPHPNHSISHSIRLSEPHISHSYMQPPLQPPPLMLSQHEHITQDINRQPLTQSLLLSHPLPPVPIIPVRDTYSACRYVLPIDAYMVVGYACRELGRVDLASDVFRACISICPESADARAAYASAIGAQTAHEIAINDFSSSNNALAPVFPEDIFNDVGNALRSISRTAEAEMAYKAALNIAPRHSHAWNNLGNAIRARGAIADAMRCYGASLSCQPGFAAAHCNTAGLLRDQGKPQDAESQYRSALLSDPNLAEAAAGLGTALRDMGRTEEAVSYYMRAVNLKPEGADNHANLANTYKDLNRIEESIASYEAALSFQPDLPDAFCNMVHSLSVICDWRNRSQNFATLLAIIDRQLDALLHNSTTNSRLYHQLAGALKNSTPQLVDVSGGSRSDRDYNSSRATTVQEENSFECSTRKYIHHPSSPAVVKKVRTKFGKFLTSSASVIAPVLSCGLPSVQPFHALIYPMSPEKFRALSAAYASRAEQMVAGIQHVHQRWSLPRGARARLKVGYVSSDYNNHPYSHLTQSVYGLHTTGAIVECFCYALTPSDNSSWRLRIERECEHFRDISALTAKQSAEAIAKDGIHVLVNCNGYTKGARTELFALRPAPIQVSFMGFPGTLGAHYIEYFITDVITSPPRLASRMHSEALLYHPHSYFVNDHRQTSIPGPASFPSGALTRAHYGLPEDCFLFLMHNQLYKLSPDTFDVWARILKRVPRSKIWLLRFPPTGEQRIKAEAAKRGLSPDRLIFTDVAGKEEHVARAGLGDLFLDTPTCNAHTTGTDVLWSGVPMITCPGSLFASRVAASLLTAAGVPELIAADMNEYEDLAVELATNRGRLAAIRHKIEVSRYTNALFDTERWVRNVEALYWQAWRNFESGSEPQHIFGQDVFGGTPVITNMNPMDNMYSATDSRRSETLVHGKLYSSTVAT